MNTQICLNISFLQSRLSQHTYLSDIWQVIGTSSIKYFRQISFLLFTAQSSDQKNFYQFVFSFHDLGLLYLVFLFFYTLKNKACV